MAHKQAIKLSEARIMIFLNIADKTLRYPRKMSQKLLMDYGYLLNRLADMIEKGWLSKFKVISQPSRTYYKIEDYETLRLANELLASETEKCSEK